VLKLVLRVREDLGTESGGLWLGIDEDEEREMEESGAGRGNENDRLGLDFEEPWGNPREEPLESEVLSAGGRGAREGDEDPGSRPRVNRSSGLKVEPGLELDDDERGDAKTPPLA
jgi:hypothetical protein